MERCFEAQRTRARLGVGVALLLVVTGGVRAAASPAGAPAAPSATRAPAQAPSPTPASGASPAAAPEAPAVREFPPGAVADALARLTPTTVPAATPPDLGAEGRVPALAADAWRDARTWNAWADLVARERVASGAASAPSNTPSNTSSSAASNPTDTADARAERRARLALLALEHGRSDDAWAHLAATSPAWAAALLPRFVPGVPAGCASGVGGSAGALDAGVVLAPSLPPPSRERVAGRVDRRAMSVRDVTIGATRVSLRVSVEAEGVQIDVRHLAGPETSFAVRIPRSPDWTYADEYVDWYRQETGGVPHRVTVKPGEEEHTLYARFDAPRTTSAAGLPARLPAGLVSGGLWFVVPEGDEELPYLSDVARALERTGLGFTCGVRAGAAPSSGMAGTTVDLTDRAARPAKLAWLASAIEHFGVSR